MAGIDLDLDVPAGALVEVVAVLHAAFAQFGEGGKPSGAMLETVESLDGERAEGTRIGVARLGGRIVAVVKHRPTEDGRLYFSRLGVAPGHRGRGIAGALVRALREDAHARALRGLACSVRAEETGNIALYERLGMSVWEHGVQRSLTGAEIPVVRMRDV